ncbi:MAG: hypothetical protein Q4F72_04005, partial [Desulfovibrionaceae bacterium]|nr:hypothetical protein [Desulfovibrionaceae bacterium]
FPVLSPDCRDNEAAVSRMGGRFRRVFALVLRSACITDLKNSRHAAKVLSPHADNDRETHGKVIFFIARSVTLKSFFHAFNDQIFPPCFAKTSFRYNELLQYHKPVSITVRALYAYKENSEKRTENLEKEFHILYTFHTGQLRCRPLRLEPLFFATSVLLFC